MLYVETHKLGHLDKLENWEQLEEMPDKSFTFNQSVQWSLNKNTTLQIIIKMHFLNVSIWNKYKLKCDSKGSTEKSAFV